MHHVVVPGANSSLSLASITVLPNFRRDFAPECHSPDLLPDQMRDPKALQPIQDDLIDLCQTSNSWCGLDHKEASQQVRSPRGVKNKALG